MEYIPPLNLSLSREENRGNVKENYLRTAAALGLSLESFTACRYEHGNDVFEISEDVLGSGILRQSVLPFCDGVITRKKGVTAVSNHADCTPIFFADKNGSAQAFATPAGRVRIKKLQET